MEGRKRNNKVAPLEGRSPGRVKSLKRGRQEAVGGERASQQNPVLNTEEKEDIARKISLEMNKHHAHRAKRNASEFIKSPIFEKTEENAGTIEPVQKFAHTGRGELSPREDPPAEGLLEEAVEEGPEEVVEEGLE